MVRRLNMDRFDGEIHPIYGAIHADGEFVHQGDILGLSVDEKEIVTAPISGWLRLITSPTPTDSSLHVQILVNKAEGVSRSATEVPC